MDQVIEHFEGDIEPVKKSMMNVLGTLIKERTFHSFPLEKREALLNEWQSLPDNEYDRITAIFLMMADGYLSNKLEIYNLTNIDKNGLRT
jgi:uncharacterized membrane protein YjdF